MIIHDCFCFCWCCFKLMLDFFFCLAFFFSKHFISTFIHSFIAFTFYTHKQYSYDFLTRFSSLQDLRQIKNICEFSWWFFFMSTINFPVVNFHIFFNNNNFIRWWHLSKSKIMYNYYVDKKYSIFLSLSLSPGWWIDHSNSKKSEKIWSKKRNINSVC